MMKVMAHPFLKKERALQLRKEGYSLKEIAKRVRVVKSTVSLWVRNVDLDDRAKTRLLTKISVGQLVGGESRRRKVQRIMKLHYREASRALHGLRLDDVSSKLLCAMIYWCEGGKNHYQGIRFTNSDPKLIRTFLFLLRKSFKADERKFRACIYLHAYHDAAAQLDFWSKITNIKKAQFIKPYQKANTGKRIREGYQGCVSIYYHSNDLARQLLIFAKAFFSRAEYILKGA